MLALHDVKHGTAKVRSPRTNGFVERMNRTLLDEHFRIKGREKWYESAGQIQRDLDAFLEFYNLKRSQQGYRLKGRTPAQALREALDSKKLSSIRGEDRRQESGTIGVIVPKVSGKYKTSTHITSPTCHVTKAGPNIFPEEA